MTSAIIVGLIFLTYVIWLIDDSREFKKRIELLESITGSNRTYVYNILDRVNKLEQANKSLKNRVSDLRDSQQRWRQSFVSLKRDIILSGKVFIADEEKK